MATSNVSLALLGRTDPAAAPMATSNAKPVSLALLDSDGNLIESLPIIDRGARNPFNSGSTGYNSTGKLVLRNLAGADAKHQISFSAVEIGSQDEALALVAAERRSKKEQLAAKVKELTDQMKHLA